MRRRTVAAVVAAVTLAAGACASDDGPEPATPAENIDRDSDNVITGPINRARDTADDAEDHYQQLEQGP